eukprot:gene7296-5249_t
MSAGSADSDVAAETADALVTSSGRQRYSHWPATRPSAAPTGTIHID